MLILVGMHILVQGAAKISNTFPSYSVWCVKTIATFSWHHELVWTKGHRAFIFETFDSVDVTPYLLGTRFCYKSTTSKLANHC